MLFVVCVMSGDMPGRSTLIDKFWWGMNCIEVEKTDGGDSILTSISTAIRPINVDIPSMMILSRSNFRLGKVLNAVAVIENPVYAHAT